MNFGILKDGSNFFKILKSKLQIDNFNIMYIFYSKYDRITEGSCLWLQFILNFEMVDYIWLCWTNKNLEKLDRILLLFSVKKVHSFTLTEFTPTPSFFFWSEMKKGKNFVPPQSLISHSWNHQRNKVMYVM